MRATGTARCRAEETAEHAETAKTFRLCSLCALCGSLFGTCWASIPTLSRKKPSATGASAHRRQGKTGTTAQQAIRASDGAVRADAPDSAESLRARAWFAPAIFAVALLVRLVHVWQLRSSPFFATLMGDSRSYDEWARQIAGGDWLGHEVFYQAPLYPYLLGAIYTVAGRHLLLVRIIQALIGSLSCALLASAAARLFSPRTGIAAGLMLALYAPAIFFDGLLQKSVLDVFFVCLALWLISRSEKTAETVKNAENNTEKKDFSQRSLRAPRFFLYVALGLTMGG